MEPCVTPKSERSFGLESLITTMPSRRDSGEGTYEQLPSGKWRWVVMQNGRRRKSPAKEKKSEAKTALLKILEDERKAADIPSQSFTTLAQAWVKNHKMSPTTREVYNWWIDAWEKDGLGALSIADMNESAVRGWMSRSTLAPITIKRRLGMLRTVLRSVGVTLDITPPRRAPAVRRPLNPQERKVFLALAEELEPKAKLGLLLCYYLGVTRSEACGLMWRDYRDGRISIVRSVVETRDAIHVKPPKTEHRRRRVKVPPPLIPYLEQRGSGYILGDKEPMHPKYLSNVFAYMVKGTVLMDVPHIGLHTLRRTCGMILLESGVDPKTASKILGHDVLMLLTIYTESREDLMEAAMDRAFGT